MEHIGSEAPGQEKSTDTELGGSGVLLDMEQAIPENVEGIKLYQEKIVEYQKFLSVSTTTSSTYLID